MTGLIDAPSPLLTPLVLMLISSKSRTTGGESATAREEVSKVRQPSSKAVHVCAME
jgi:hypothetical protein